MLARVSSVSGPSARVAAPRRAAAAPRPVATAVASRAPRSAVPLSLAKPHGRFSLATVPRRAHSQRPAGVGAGSALSALGAMPNFSPLAILAAAGFVLYTALSSDEAEAAEKGKEKAPQPARQEIDDAEDAMELLNVRDFSLEQARSWLNNYATSPQPEAFLSGLRPLLRDLFKALEEAEKASDTPPDELQYRMMHLIGFIGGAVHRNAQQVLPRLEALMLTQNDLSEQPGLLLGVLMPALIMAGTKEGGGLAMQVFGLMREMEAEYNKSPKPEPKKLVAEFQKMAQSMVRNMFPVLPMVCLGRFAGTGDAKMLEQAYSALNKLLQEINNEKQANPKMPPEAEAAAASLRSVCGTAFREFSKSSPAAAKALAENPVSKEKYPFAHAIIRAALDGKDAPQPKIKAPPKK